MSDERPGKRQKSSEACMQERGSCYLHAAVTVLSESSAFEFLRTGDRGPGIPLSVLCA
jgi:hypothetical protein